MVAAWAVIFGLILLTAVYVAAEFAAVSVRRSRLRRLAEDGHRLAARLLPVVEDARLLDRYIAASQIGITFGSLVLGAYGQARLSPVVAPLLVRAGVEPGSAESTAAAAILIGLTILGVIFGELVPKSLALQYPTQIALWTVVPMRWSLRGMAWFIWILNGSGILLLRLFGVHNTGHRHIHSPEELEMLIAESRDGGLLEPEEQVRLHKALQLRRRTARELMVPRERLVSLDAAQPFDEIVRAVASSPYTRLPVWRGHPSNVIGMLRTKDLALDYISGDGKPDAPRQIDSLVQPIVRVPETMPADRLIGFLRERRAHNALVTDESGEVAGLITLEDVASALLGQVQDELKARPEAKRG
ncbi:MAG: hemolysin family protein [Vicinamibacterales bacterium]